jgi:molecular chaperone DnaJ
VLRVAAHDIFEREGDDLLCEVPIAFTLAALGGEVKVPTLNGAATIKVPAGTQPNTMFRLRGKGIRNVQGYGHGDLHVRVNVEVPTRLNGPQRTKLQEFAELCNGKESPIIQSFLEKAKKLFKA